jgi:hypothetical protein
VDSVAPATLPGLGRQMREERSSMYTAPQRKQGSRRRVDLTALGAGGGRMILIAAVVVVALCGCVGITFFRGVLGLGDAGTPVGAISPSPSAATAVDAVPGSAGAPGSAAALAARVGPPAMASALGPGNRPSVAATSFPPAGPIIYVTARVTNVAAGDSFFARWMHEGKPFDDSARITATHPYPDTYVEFHIQPNPAQTFPTGAWTVQIFANGAPGPITQFTVK